MQDICFRQVIGVHSKSQTYPRPPRVICIAICQVNSVIGDS